MNKTSMNERIKMAFDGWASQFENIPSWRPNLETRDNQLYLDGHLLSSTEKNVASLAIDVEGITVFWDEGASIVVVDWQFEGEPSIKEICERDL